MKKKKDPDYTLNIFHHYEEKIRRDVVVFLVQTVRIFTSFRYEILLESEVSNHNINIKITGLHVPELLMPQTGPARARRDYENLEGIYRLAVIKQDRTVNEYSVKFTSSTVEIVGKPRDPFILISNEPVSLS
jgi:hypothetical protein